MKMSKLLILLIYMNVPFISAFDWSTLKLVKSHVPYFFNHHDDLKQSCIEDPSCPFKVSLLKKSLCFFLI